jgi:hypothetical protein
VKHVLPWLAWWIALFWLWFLLVGEWNNQEIAGAAISATIAASLAELARKRTGFSARIPLRGLADVPGALGMVVVDFGILAWALLAGVARRRIVRGRLISREFDGGAGAGPGVGPRAWAVLIASYSPNAFVLDVDPGTKTVLIHDLVPYAPSERPA